MKLKITTNPADGPLPIVTYCWDAQTGILGARLSRCHEGSAEPSNKSAAGIVEITGDDGSWLHLESNGGRLEGLEIAVWPEFAPDRPITIPAAQGHSDALIEIDADHISDVLALSTTVRVVPDSSAKTVRLCFGTPRSKVMARVADNMLVATDKRGMLAEIWLLRVPCELHALDSSPVS